MLEESDVTELVNKRMNRVLLYAESSLHPAQFKVFRKLTLDEFGRNGLGKDIRQLANDNGPHGPGKDRYGPE